MKNITICLILIFLLPACKKDWLNTKANKSIVAAHTLKDYEALLNNINVFNKGYNGAMSLAETGTDDYYTGTSSWQSLNQEWEKNAYIFAKDVFSSTTNIQAWNLPYQRVFYANVVLDGLRNKTFLNEEQLLVDRLRGAALFFRANAFFQTSVLFSKNYTRENASALGIPLRLSSDINIPTVRPSLRQTYQQILDDLKQSAMLLPEVVNYKTNPSKQAAFGLLSRVYHSMGVYDSSLKYADKCLEITNVLLNFSELDSNASYPLTANNSEVIFNDQDVSDIFSPATCYVDTLLFTSYANADLRRNLFYYSGNPGNLYKGSYTGSSTLFTGISVNEIYLNRAECYARKNNPEKALGDLNILLSHRWREGEFEPIETNDHRQVLSWILQERRKELCFRGLRWIDLRRLNESTEYSVTIERLVDGVRFKLPPNDPRYVYPIPGDIIAFTGVQQNER